MECLQPFSKPFKVLLGIVYTRACNLYVYLYSMGTARANESKKMYGQKHAENDFTVLFRFPENLSGRFLPLVFTMAGNIVVVVAVAVPVCPKIGKRAKNLSLTRRMKSSRVFITPMVTAP